MQQEDDLRSLENIIQFIRAVSALFLLLNLYWFCYEWFSAHSLTAPVADRILLGFQRTTALFSYSVTTKLCAFVLLALSCYGTKSVRDENISRRDIAVAGAVGLLLFFFNDFLRFLPFGSGIRFWSYSLTLVAGYLCLLAAGVWLGRLMKQRLADDPFNNENESFEQESRCLSNEYSVNLPTRYYFRGRGAAAGSTSLTHSERRWYSARPARANPTPW